MARELKIRLPNSQEVEEKLKNLEAIFIIETNFVDIYFHQPPGEVLKIATNEDITNLVRLKTVNGTFEVISKHSVENVDNLKTELSNKYGIKAVLQGKRRRFQLGDLEITLNFIDEIGQFLILTGENPTEEFITEKLGIKNPEYIRVSFDELRSY